MAYVLLVEDDQRLSELIVSYLSQQGFEVKHLSNGDTLLSQVKQTKPDIVLLDVMLPGENGFTLCRQIRPFYNGPLLFMTAKGDDFDQVLGLEIGADDYIVKPVEPRVLLARINALLRRARHLSSPSLPVQKLVFGQLVIDKNARCALLKGRNVQLTSHEFDMLWKLAENASTLVERSVLYDELIGREYDGLDRSADVRISRLRKKLEDNPLHPYRIKTIWGKGFFFVAEAWDE
ncbi:response regulator [Flavobacterium sp. W21_SRS_FM6]|uniref:response regulator n=1 Tax=Flavobacterium sp. W21_SRS_FM6 TaxID=3240268 RepID=UPI003F8EDE5D